jgi:hypothetical protein
MTIEEALYTKLNAASAVTTLLSAATAIYPAPLPQEIELSCISFQRIDTPRQYAHNGYSNLATPRIQVDCWADEYEKAYALANAVRQAVQASTSGWGTVTVYACFMVDERDSFEENPRTFRRSLDLQIHHQET